MGLWGILDIRGGLSEGWVEAECSSQQAVHHNIRVAPDGGGEVGIVGHSKSIVPPLGRVLKVTSAEILGILR